MPQFRFKTLDDMDVGGKTVILRIDLNSPVDPQTGRIRDNERIRAHARTVRELAERGARVVVLAHQGRRGEPDFLPLEEHAALLSKHVGRPVKYVPDLVGERAIEAIKAMRDGEIVLLENVRTLEEETREGAPEEHSRGRLVSTLAPLAQLFVQDAFSAAHRAHASIIGFAHVLPTVAGRVMEQELRALSKVLEEVERITLVMGGNKPDDCLAVVEAFIARGRAPEIKRLLSAGVLGELFLSAEGKRLGEETEAYLRKKGFDQLLGKAEEVKKSLGERVETPLDLAYERDGKRVEIRVEKLPAPGMILDIGEKTAEKYAQQILEAGEEEAIIVKGPAGAYEREEFRKGTKIIYDALARTRAFTLIGGGDSSTAITLVSHRPEEFSYVSLGGGALIRYLSGKKMPGIEVLMKRE